MSMQLRLGDETQELAPTCDLNKFLRNATGAFHMAAPSAVLSLTLAEAPTGAFQLPFTTDQPLAWDLGAQGNVSFDFVPTVTGVVQIQNSGVLFQYNLGEDEAYAVTVPVPTGMAYVSASLSVAMGVSGGPGFSAGDFGVSAQVDASTQFMVIFRKAFPVTATISDAIRSTFDSFVLPFRANGAESMSDKDYLDYEFFGKIGAGVGITYGVSGNLLSGRAISEIEQTLSVSNLGQAIMKHLPEYQAGASFAAEYSHVDTFRVIAGRQHDATVNSATMCVFRRRDKVVTTTETVGIQSVPPVDSDIVSNLEMSGVKLAKSAFASIVEPDLKAKASAGLAKALGPNTGGPMKQYLEDVAEAIKDLVTKPENQAVQLELQQAKIRENTALFNLTFDCDRPGALEKGYELAMAGDLAGALKVPGVDLHPGSYVESAFLKKSAATLQFFDLYKFSDVTEYFDRTSVVYAGNGLFRLILRVGAEDDVTVNGKENSCEVYFTAEAPERAVGNTDGDFTVRLNFTIIDQSSGPAQETLRALRFMGGPAFEPATLGIPKDLKGQLKVTCEFGKDAFSRFRCDDYAAGKPPKMPHPVDASNYGAFVAAIRGILPEDNLNQDFLRLCSSYNDWAGFNRVKIDQEGSQATPDRRSTGNAAVSQWPAKWNGIGEGERSGLQCYLYAAQSYMNLCDSLKHLATNLDAGKFEDHFDLLKKSLEGIIKQNIDVFFIKPAWAALFGSSSSVAAGISSKTVGDNFELSFTADLARTGAAGGK